jgi:hypothetical protein
MKRAILLALLVAGCGASRQQLAADDDATCQSYGTQPGSQAYVQCRMQRDGIRQQGQESRRTAIASQPMIPLVAPQMR